MAGDLLGIDIPAIPFLNPFGQEGLGAAGEVGMQNVSRCFCFCFFLFVVGKKYSAITWAIELWGSVFSKHRTHVHVRLHEQEGTSLNWMSVGFPWQNNVLSFIPEAQGTKKMPNAKDPKCQLLNYFLTCFQSLLYYV